MNTNLNVTKALKEVQLEEQVLVKILESNGQRALFAKKAFHKEECIFPFSSRLTMDAPSYLTLQINDNTHILINPIALECVNHSCEPNCFFDIENYELIALCDIAQGEELKFFYPSTEWCMDQGFQCNCGSSSCLQHINGAYSIPIHEIKRYRLSPFIKAKLDLLGSKDSNL
ncbi:MAG TPA: SET domain-containing protein-lysine N-methyltransferase [Saprospiraceae bacterium]|nr:SET domain-containing protein-lysine N-methyltransferase [Saprospiraceae bacterium]